MMTLIIRELATDTVERRAQVYQSRGVLLEMKTRERRKLFQQLQPFEQRPESGVLFLML
jgi:hypothetical protein